jgi:phenylpropionate dioxygenase-like ring-hydroxylating dioxygenase large terminal subunit
MVYHRNAWYVAAHSRQITREALRRTLLDDALLFYRSEQGDVIALRDQCPHRFAPLSRGKILGDQVQCAYHGLQFDREGRCVHNPHGSGIAPHNRVASYPVVERHGFVWVWTGDPALADPGTVPDLSYMTAPGVRTAYTYINPAYRYDILIDNLLDLSHADYLHVGSFMGGECGESETRVTEDGHEVVTRYVQRRAPAPPSIPGLPELVDQSFVIRWHPGQVVSFEYRVSPVSGPLDDMEPIRFAHIATPEREGRTHYFMSTTRNYALDDPAVDEESCARMVAVIDSEDSPMLLAVDHEMRGRDLMDMHPVILPTDRGALGVRRMMRKLLQAEQVNTASPPPQAVQPSTVDVA